MKFPANISYFLRKRQNHKLPYYFNDFLLNKIAVPDTFHKAEDYRKEMLVSHEELVTEEFGAGSKTLNPGKRAISEIATISGTNSKYGLLFHKIVKQFGSGELLELGTSAGIGTMYFATSSELLNITTIEACKTTCLFAEKKIKLSGLKNKFHFINNDFDSVFEKDLLKEKFDLIFIDGNHKGNKLIKYYNEILANYVLPKYIIIIDDINWSNDMFKAWQIIKRLDNSSTYLDLFRMGIVISGYDIPKGFFTINFVNKEIL